MRTVVVVPPEPIVTWAEADAHLRLDGDDSQQSYVEGLIAAATAHIDGPNGILRRAVGEQTLELRTCGFYHTLTLPFGPVTALESVKYLDTNGDEQTVDAGVYYLAGDGIYLSAGQSWPAHRSAADSVRIRYVAGWPTDEVPAAIKHAALLLLGHWFANREAVTATGQVELPMAVDALLSPFRFIRV